MPRRRRGGAAGSVSLEVLSQELEGLLPGMLGGIPVVVVAGGIREGMARPRVDVNRVLLAETLERRRETLDLVDRNALVLRTEQAQERRLSSVTRP